MQSIKFKRGNFNDRHPLSLFLFYVFIIGFTMFTDNPVCRIISCLLAFVSLCVIKGGRGLLLNIRLSIPLAILTILINPLFNHRGRTILWYFPNGNALTLEAICYGISSGILLMSIMAWFGCFNETFDSDKILYLFGKCSPNLSLVVCMSLRFVPEFMAKAAQINAVSKSLYGVNSNESMSTLNGNRRETVDKKNNRRHMNKIKRGMYVLSALISWALEHSINKSKSMKNREYGKAPRTNYSYYTWHAADICMIIVGTASFACCIFVLISGYLKFWYYPVFYGQLWNFRACIAYSMLIILGLMPAVFDLELLGRRVEA